MPRALLLTFVALHLLGRTVGATVVVPWSDSEMLALADEVATGIVEQVESVRLGTGAVETRATVRVATLLKGQSGTSRLVLRQPGGIVGDLVVGVFGTTALAPGDSILVFGRRD